MENEHLELIIGYLQGRLQGRSLDDFYAWVNESADNKKLFFEMIAGFAFSIRESPASAKGLPY